MTAQHDVCRLCFDTIKEKDAASIDESLRGILQTVLVRIDLTISENPVICSICHKKLEANYNFKKKCIFTEDSITPFVADNVKLNLKEVRNQIIKSEDMEDDDQNLCRLCLQFVDNDMTLSDSEREQFRQFFPEIDLSRTNFVILCSPCYDFLHKYFIFVTTCLELEQQLCNYSLDQAESKLDATEERVSIKLENFQKFREDVEEEDKKEVVLNEELDIKCDTEEDDERYYDGPQIEDFEKLEDASGTFLGKTLDIQFENGIAMYRCVDCNYKTKRRISLKEHIISKHADPSQIKIYNCELCPFGTRIARSFKKHMRSRHIQPDGLQPYRCQLCTYESPDKNNLKRHALYKHTSSELKLLHCKFCDNAYKIEYDLKRHTFLKHTGRSEVETHRCEHCNHEFKNKYSLKKHVKIRHTERSELELYKCKECAYESKFVSYLKSHIRSKHTDISELEMHGCEACDYKAKSKGDVRWHNLIRHSDPLATKMYQCKDCKYESHFKSAFKNHVKLNHSDPSKIQLYECKECKYSSKFVSNLGKHVRTRHADPSKLSMFKCEQCDYQAKVKAYLKKHIAAKHPNTTTHKIDI